MRGGRSNFPTPRAPFRSHGGGIPGSCRRGLDSSAPASSKRPILPPGALSRLTGGSLHVVEKSPPGRASDQPVIVLIHGAGANLRDQENALGERLSRTYRVVLVDRPGHGWSTPGSSPDAASPSGQAALLRGALQRLGVGPSCSSVIPGAAQWPRPMRSTIRRIWPGLILLAPVAYPWVGGTSWYYELGATPILGPAFAHLFALPTGLLLTASAVQLVFSPNEPPPDYVSRVSARLALRPSEFLANSREVAGLKAFVAGQAERYRHLAVPTIIIAGSADAVVPANVHARPLAAALPHARLLLLQGVGHMPHYAAPDRVLEAVAEFADGMLKAKAAPGR